jgi:hypothetical protein
MGYNGLGDCPYLEDMRAHGECHWYYDNYRHGALADVATDEAAKHEVIAPAGDTVEAAVDVTVEATEEAAEEAIAKTTVEATADCWYDCQTEEYYRYEFSDVSDEAVASEDAMCEDVAESSTSEATAWDEGACMDEFYADEFYADEVCPDEVYPDCADQAPVAEVCRKPADTVSEDVATEDAWRGDYDYGYDYYQDYESNDSTPVQASEDADVEAVEDDDDAVPPAPASDLVRIDSGIILSLARALDRVGSTLQSMSHYLTEIATADVAERHGSSIHR